MNLRDYLVAGSFALGLGLLGGCASGKLEERVSNEATAVTDTLTSQEMNYQKEFMAKLMVGEAPDSVVSEVRELYNSVPEDDQYLYFGLQGIIDTFELRGAKSEFKTTGDPKAYFDTLKGLMPSIYDNVEDANKALAASNGASQAYKQEVMENAGTAYLNAGVLSKEIYDVFTSDFSTPGLLKERDAFADRAERMYEKALELNPGLSRQIGILESQLEQSRNYRKIEDSIRKEGTKKA